MMKTKKIKVFAPATVANVSCGFDVLGFALHEPGDEITLVENDAGELRIRDIIGDEGNLPREVENNTASAVIKNILGSLGIRIGIDITLHKKMPLGSGLGSSAASAVAGAFAINALLGYPLTKDQLLKFTIQGEGVACGSEHADNVAPALYGGFVLIRSYDPLDIVQLPSPSELFATVIHPQIEIKTKDAREILKKDIPLKNAIKQWGNVGGLIAGLYKNDYELIGRSMHDHIIEPIRSILIPGYDQVKKAALDSGVLGCAISGSGPSIFALSKGEGIARKAAEKMSLEFKKIGADSDIYVSKINSEGPMILE
jgi:homoserine kinase